MLTKVTIRHSFLALIFLSYGAFGIYHLSQFITADEHYWVSERIPEYWEAISSHKWKKTFINDKPGVSLALVSGIASALHPESITHCSENRDKFLVCDTKKTEALYLAFRLPILIVNGLLLFFLFFVIRKLTNDWIALWTTTLTALSPILLGISQMVNPDSLLWSFGTAGLFSFFAWLSSREQKFLFFTTLFTGLALLSKYTALILLPFYLLLLLWRFLSQKNTAPLTEMVAVLKKDFFLFILVTCSTLALLVFFLPALIIDSKYLDSFLLLLPKNQWLLSLSGGLFLLLSIDIILLRCRILLTLRQKLFHFHRLHVLLPLIFTTLFLLLLGARYFFPTWNIFALIPFDIKDLSDARYYTTVPNFFEAFLLEWNPLIFSLTPITLLGFFLLLYTLFRKTPPYFFVVGTILSFTLLYTVLLIFANVLSTPRYSILLYPIFALLASLGYWYVSEQLPWRYNKQLFTLCLFVGSLLSLNAIKPFYFNYTNFLLPKVNLINDAWGYGGYEAAKYLNSLPDAEHLTVWVDYYGVCEFFVGKCLSAYTFDPVVVSPDYYVLTRRGEIRYRSRAARWEEKSGLTAYRYYSQPHPAWQLIIGERPGNFIKVVRVENE